MQMYFISEGNCPWLCLWLLLRSQHLELLFFLLLFCFQLWNWQEIRRLDTNLLCDFRSFALYLWPSEEQVVWEPNSDTTVNVPKKKKKANPVACAFWWFWRVWLWWPPHPIPGVGKKLALLLKIMEGMIRLEIQARVLLVTVLRDGSAWTLDPYCMASNSRCIPQLCNLGQTMLPP